MNALIYSAFALFFYAASHAKIAASPCLSDGDKCKSVEHSMQEIFVNRKVDGQTLQASEGDIWWRHSIATPNARFVRLHFVNIASRSGPDYELRISNSSGGVVGSYRRDTFARSESFSTGLLPSGDLEIQLLSSSKPSTSFSLERVTWPAGNTSTVPESLVAAWRSIGVPGADDKVREAAAATVLLHIGPSEAHCSGSMVGQLLVATNYHCLINSLDFLHSEKLQVGACGDILIEFDYYYAGARGETTTCEFAAGSKEEDLAVLRVSDGHVPPVQGAHRKPLELSAEVAAGSGAVVLHYPLGLPLAFQDNCFLRSVSLKDLQHDCSTVAGSSGAPVLDLNYRWVGVHYMGPFPRDWTVERIEERLKKGPVYNHARPSSMINELIGRLAR